MPKIRKMLNGKIRLVNATDLDSDRIRFNWGYHDGAREIDRPNPNRTPGWEARHFDPVYVAGHAAGTADKRNGTYAGNSESAWIASGRINGVTDYRYQ
jgi:hypothetical protein